MTLKNWFIVGIIVAIISLIGYTVVVTKKLNTVTEDRDRVSNNFLNAKFQMDSVVNKNGELEYTVKNLNVNADEFKLTEEVLNKKIVSQGYKIKNLESVIELKPKIIIKIDSFPVSKKLNDSTFISTYNDKWVAISQKVSLVNNKSDVKIGDFKMDMLGNLLILSEINYKRVWIFWKRPINITTHVTSECDYIHIDQIKVFKLTK